ncbi:MAG: competence protein CoiA family protein, partial [Clostridium sp.]|uniref:competence protein CoiA family protein n=1 Tax=Clostridium sp. TaxID=1506 RepID=UPI003EE52677
EESNQRPDIYFEQKGKRYVIEFQCTPIATEYLKRREQYQNNDIFDIWILGKDKYHKTNRVIQKHGHYYLNSKTGLLEGDSFFYGNSNGIEVMNILNIGIEEGVFKPRKSIYLDIDTAISNKDEVISLVKRNILKEFEPILKIIEADELGCENYISTDLKNKRGKKRIFEIRENKIFVFRKYCYNPSQSEKSKYRSKFGKRLNSYYKKELMYFKEIDFNNYCDSASYHIIEEIKNLI